MARLIGTMRKRITTNTRIPDIINGNKINTVRMQHCVPQHCILQHDFLVLVFSVFSACVPDADLSLLG